jgi:hypothetical protein
MANTDPGQWSTTLHMHFMEGVLICGGESWTSSDINNSNFGIAFSVDGQDEPSLEVDHIKIKVYYTETGGKHYSRESDNTLGTDDSNLATIFSEQEYTDVGTDNDTYVDLEGTEQYFEFLFKEPNDNSTDSFRITWKGKSSLAPSSSTVYLQVYNRTLSQWETLDSDNSVLLILSLSRRDAINRFEQFYDANYVITVRVYQDVS